MAILAPLPILGACSEPKEGRASDCDGAEAGTRLAA